MRARCMRLLTGRVTSIEQQRAPRRQHRSVRLSRHRWDRRAAGRGRPVHPGLLAHPAEPDRQRRPSLAGGHAVPGQYQRLFDGTHGGPVRRLRASATDQADASAICSIPACSTRAAGRRSTSCTTPEPRATTPSTTTSRPTSASPGSPNVETGWLRAILGDPAQATVRASYGVSYNSDGLSFYTGVYGNNPGDLITTNRTSTSTQFPLVPPGESWPVLLRDPGRLGPSPGIPPSPALSAGGRLQQRREPVPSGLQDAVRPVVLGRSCSGRSARQMAVEVRYVGTRLVDGTTTENWNEINWTTNGFLGGVQARAGQPAGQHRGRPRARRSPTSVRARARRRCRSTWRISTAARRATPAMPSLYTGTNWTNTARLAELAHRNPNPGAAASTLFTTAAFRTSMVAAGYPSNFFVLNPAVNNAQVRTNGESTTYDSLQVTLRRALSNGLAVDANYVFSTRVRVTPEHAARGASAGAIDRRRAARAEVDGHLRAAVRPRASGSAPT